ncbi:MAG: hypothetical protein RSF70_09790, partial [Ruthenibacterium sp.]
VTMELAFAEPYDNLDLSLSFLCASFTVTPVPAYADVQNQAPPTTPQLNLFRDCDKIIKNVKKQKCV